MAEEVGPLVERLMELHALLFREELRKEIIRIVGDDPDHGLAVLACFLDALPTEEDRREVRCILMNGVTCEI